MHSTLAGKLALGLMAPVVESTPELFGPHCTNTAALAEAEAPNAATAASAISDLRKTFLVVMV
jgi:hypothetical protein